MPHSNCTIDIGLMHHLRQNSKYFGCYICANFSRTTQTEEERWISVGILRVTTLTASIRA
jgi:hypothetical protein